MRFPAPFRRRKQPDRAAVQIVDLAVWNDGGGAGPLTQICRPDALDPIDHRVVGPQPIRADVLLAVSQLVQELAPAAVDGSRGDILDHTIENWRSQWHEAIDAAAQESRATVLRLEQQQTQDLAVAAEHLRRLRGDVRTLRNTANYYRDCLLGVNTQSTPPATVTPAEAARALPALQTGAPVLPELTEPSRQHPNRPGAGPAPIEQDPEHRDHVA